MNSEYMSIEIYDVNICAVPCMSECSAGIYESIDQVGMEGELNGG
jgi:hypothetical protein